MDQLLWNRIGELFAEAQKLGSAERVAFLKERCGDDRELLDQVMSLLEADNKSGPLDSKPTVTAFPLPEVIADRFRIVRYIAEGGMGTVYEAEDLTLEDRVALKTIRPDIVSHPHAVDRFKREISLGKKVTHPNVCRIHDLGVGHAKDGSEFLFLTMQFLTGETLASRIKRGPIPANEALPLIEDMTAALSAAHQANVIHRDFKSGNVIMVNRSDRVCAVVTDFGLARQVHDDASLSQTAMVGTVSYMAPEQIRGEELTPATDIYALGVVMYEMMTGELPFRGDSNVTIALKHLNEEPKPPRELAPSLDPRWQEAILGCLKKSPEKRFQSGHEVRENLQCRSRRWNGDAWRRAGRRLGYLAAVVSAAIAILVGFASVNPVLRERLRGILHVPPATKIASAFTERDRILLTDFDNQTDDPAFDRTVRDLLGQALSQSSYVNVVPRMTALDAARRTGTPKPTQIDANLGRQICIREGYRAMLTGTIRPLGSGFRIELTVENPHADQVLLTEFETVPSANKLYESVDRLALRLRERLGESLKLAEKDTKPLEEVTTPSLEALRRYSQAVDLFANHQYARSIELADDAIRLDPHFAMAHLLLAESYDNLGAEKQSREHFRLARAELPHASEREQHLILASDYLSQEDMEQACKEYQHLLDLYPDDIDALRGFSECAYWTDRIDEAIGSQRKALTLSQNSVLDYTKLMTLMVRASQFDQALAVLVQARSHGFDTPQLQFIGAIAAWGNGDVGTAQATFSRLIATRDEYWRLVGYLWTGKLLSFQGRMNEAAHAFSSGLLLVNEPERSDWVPVYQYMLARTLILMGDEQRARVESTKLLTAVQAAPAPENLQRAGSVALQVGMVGSAETVMGMLRQQAVGRNSLFTNMQLFTLQGDLDLAYHRYASAAQNARRALAFRPSFEPYFVLGKACEAMSEWQCAIESYKTFISLKGSILRDDYPADWVIANYYLARAYFEGGRTEEGLKQYGKFQVLFPLADNKLPIISVSKEEVKKLKTPPHVSYVQ